MPPKSKAVPNTKTRTKEEKKNRAERFSQMGSTARWNGRGDGPPPSGLGFKFFPDRMKWARERAKMSREALGVSTGYSPTSLSAYEDGRQSPAADRIEVLAKHLKVSAEWLFNGSGPVPAQDPSA